MRLPMPPPKHDPVAEIERNRLIEAADRENHKRNRDVEIYPARLILTSPNGSRWSVEVSNAGALSATAL